MERIGGALALATLGDEHPSARPACAGLLCAYLRTVPDSWDVQAHTMPRVESDVRDEITALIAQRLRPGTGDEWLPVHVDFARAIFGPNADLSRCEFTLACTFTSAVFTGTATFDRARFSAPDYGPESWAATLTAETPTAQNATPTPHPAELEVVRHSFQDATFVGNASFFRAMFDGPATFVGSQFHEDAIFSRATCSSDLLLLDAEIPRLDVTLLVVGGDLHLGWAKIAGIRGGRLTVNGELSLAYAEVRLACFLPRSRIGKLRVDRATFGALLDLSDSRIGAWSAEDTTFHGEVYCPGTGFTADAFTSQ